MIENRELFAKRLISLLKYFHKSSDDFILDTWFTVCNEQLSDKEFEEGYILVLRKKEFLPPIDDFIKLIKGEDEVLNQFELSEVWDRIVSLSAIATSLDKDHRLEKAVFLRSLEPAQKYALDKVGGLVNLGLVPVDKLHWKKKEFLGHCKTYQQVEEIKKDDGRAIAALPESTAREIDLGNYNEPELERVAVSRGNGFSSIGDALF